MSYYTYYSKKQDNPVETEQLLKQASYRALSLAAAEGSLASPEQLYTERLGTDSSGLWLRSFLIKPGVRNSRGWGIDSSTALQNVYSIVGKPLVLHKDKTSGRLDHPEWNHHYSAEANIKNQAQDAIGEVKRVYYDKDTDAYYADSLVTDKTAINYLNGFADKKLPIPVSPQIVFDETKNEKDWYKSWQFSHLAIVQASAYPSHLSRVIETCNGDTETCHKKLAKATAVAAASASASASVASGLGYELQRDTSSANAFLAGSKIWAPANGKIRGRLD
jgi:hypothetical protein